MTPLDFLYITLSVAVIVIALAIVATTIVVIIILWEIRRMTTSIRETMLEVRKVGSVIRGGVIDTIIDYGQRIFQRKKNRKTSP